jgi:predicted AAA+ superfamily ATPase
VPETAAHVCLKQLPKGAGNSYSLAVNSAGLVTGESLRGAAGINAGTAREYQALFQRMFVLDIVPAWFSNRIKRLVKTPQRYLVDPALVAAVLGLGREAILYGPDMLGRLMDTFVGDRLIAAPVSALWA